MRHSIGQKGIGGNNESWYYLEQDELTGNFYYIHEWHNMNFRLKVDEGEKRTPLHEAEGKPFHKEALELCAKLSN